MNTEGGLKDSSTHPAIWLLYHHNAMNTEGGLKDSSTHHCYIWLLYHHNAMNTEGGLKDSNIHHCYMAAVLAYAMNTRTAAFTTAIWLLYHHVQ